MILHSFWRSLATYRAINPMGAVPALVLDDGTTLTQSLAILEWLEETHPTPPLLPQGAAARARIRALCAITVADTHPLVVPRIQRALTALGITDAQRLAWNVDWFTRGLAAYEAQIGSGPFCDGSSPTFADICIASHVAGAERFGVDLTPFPDVRAIQASCMALPAFANAHPQRQKGAPAPG